MTNDIAFSALLVIAGGYAFVRGLRAVLVGDRYSVLSIIQLVGGLVAAGAGTLWLMESIVTSLIPPS